MGHQILRAVFEEPGMMVHGALEAPGHPGIGQDAGVQAGLKPLGVSLTSDPLPVLATAQALIDFYHPARVGGVGGTGGAGAHSWTAIGTTGCSGARRREASAPRRAMR